MRGRRNGRWTMRGLGTLVLGLVLLGAGGWWRYPGVVTLGLAFTVAAALGLISVVAPAPLVPTRSVEPLEVPRYGACTGRLRLEHVGRWLPVSLEAVELVGAEHLPVPVPRLSPGERTEVAYPIPTRRRGLLPVGPLLLRRYGFGGLATSRTAVGDVVQVRVLPRVLAVRGLPAGARRGHVGAEERVEHGGTDLVGLREYVPGDDLRRLHWATSARTGTLMVREDADPARAHLAILLDDRRASYRDDEFEDAVEVVASLAWAAADAGHPVRMRTVSGRLDVEIQGSTSGLIDPAAHGLLAELAEVATVEEAGPPEPLPVRDLDVVVAVAGAQADPSALLLDTGRGAFGALLLLDQRPEQIVDAIGSVLVLRGPRAEDLLGAWDGGVVA